MSSPDQSHKNLAKSLKGPDAFQEQVLNGLAWANRNIKILAIGISPLALAVVGYLGWNYASGLRKDARLEDLGKAQVVYDLELRKAAEERQQIQKLIEAIETKISAQKAPDGKDPAAASDQAAADVAKLQAEKSVLEAKAAKIKGNHSESLNKFKEFYKKHADDAEGWMAGLTAARILLDDDKPQDARPLLESLVKDAAKNPFVLSQARVSLLGVLEELGDFDRALAELAALDKDVDPELRPKLLLAKGRLLMLKNDKEQAKATFNSLIEAHATSPEAQKARSIQALLN